MTKLLTNLSNVSQNNWTIRVKNPVWWVSMVIAFCTPVFIYYGIAGESLDTWDKILQLFTQAISNPYVLFTALVNAVAVSIDPTTTGVSDSTTALDYSTPSDK